MIPGVLMPLFVQEEEASNWFNIYKTCYEMLFVANIIGGNFRTHDNTARLQSVSGSKSPLIWKILEITRQ